jgi:hypothetical protein
MSHSDGRAWPFARKPQSDPYFHGDTGQGVGASHQTGWTALVSSVLRDLRPNSEGTGQSADVDGHSAANGARRDALEGASAR